PEWVLRRFGFTQTIPRLPRQRGLAAIYPWYAAPDYIRWYFQISHPYMRPLQPGEPPRYCEQEALIEEEAEMEGALATSL
ncbi:hypothetical protein A2U01_0067812, partial [Trifolium medium]|nr:hypothetical protein [Trifolium medium]